LSSHLWRVAIAGAGYPTWPAALEILDQVGGQRIRVGSRTFEFDIMAALSTCDLPDDLCPIGRIDGVWIGVDADGRVLIGDQVYDDLDALLISG
jgi:hypothetical protein